MMAKNITRMALTVTAAVLLGYIESLFPPFLPVPGIKIGLANAVIILVLYTDCVKSAWIVSVLRIFLCALLFGTPLSLIYSICGGVGSIIVMTIAKRTRLFSMAGVSSIGGITHNFMQLVCAYFFIGKGAILYMPVLCIVGAICGALTGIGAQILMKRGKKLFGKE